MFYDSKFVFIAGNLIVVALIGESKIFSSSSPCTEDYYDEYVSSSRELQKPLAPQVNKDEVLEKYIEERRKMTWEEGKEAQRMRVEERVELVQKGLKGLDDDELSLPTEELNKRADDYIAKVNKLRIFEATLQFWDVEKRITKPCNYQWARR